MITGISTRDLEWLSAYLDDALNAGERAALETRLKADAALSAGLKQLEATRAMLRRAPQRRVRRNFTLSPAMAGQRQPATGGWNSFSLVSAMASLLLVVVLAGDLWANGALAFGAAAPAAEEAPQALMAVESAPTLTADAAEDGLAPTEEFELYTLPEETRQMKEEPSFDARTLLLEYGRPVELGLAAIAAGAGIAALVARRRRK
jgi:anti-sigma factor RsiW